MQKHLNRDVELLAEEKPEKKASVKKSAGGQGSTSVLQASTAGSGAGQGNATGSK